jgi:hypothetical protein
MEQAAESSDKRTYEYEPYPVHNPLFSAATLAKPERGGPQVGGRRACGPQIGRCCTYFR